jgi:hypothetical protein
MFSVGSATLEYDVERRLRFQIEPVTAEQQ